MTDSTDVKALVERLREQRPYITLNSDEQFALAAALTAKEEEIARMRGALQEIANGEGEMQAIRDGGGGVEDAMPRMLRADELRALARAALGPKP